MKKYDSRFLTTLIGETLSDAQNMVRAKNLSYEDYPDGTILPLIAKEGVILFHKNGVITLVTPGDPLRWE